MDAEAIAGRYRREQRLGPGGMSEVWLAQDLELRRPVAVKLLGPGADRLRFEREARAAASLSHANICHVYELGETDGLLYIVMEYVEGPSLYRITRDALSDVFGDDLVVAMDAAETQVLGAHRRLPVAR
ncbi:MAG: protein kinase [Gemmatimonadaceae bacterium]